MHKTRAAFFVTRIQRILETNIQMCRYEYYATKIEKNKIKETTHESKVDKPMRNSSHWEILLRWLNALIYVQYFYRFRSADAQRAKKPFNKNLIYFANAVQVCGITV